MTPPDTDTKFFRGCMIAMPISLLLWIVLFAIVYAVAQIFA